jgi:AcrR family transcriptional regulator
MTRNRDDTSQRLLDAAFRTLLDDGFADFGVNTIARAAGCDKKLIYRYFDGLDGLLQAMGRVTAERLQHSLGTLLTPQPANYAEMAERLIIGLFRHLNSDPAYCHLRLLEATSPGAATDTFRAARGQAMSQWMTQARAGLPMPTGMDVFALNAALIATVEGLVILSPPAGLPIVGDATNARLEAALKHLVAGVYRQS